MSNPNYTLEIISHHSKFNNKVLRKYYVDGIETVGAWGDEPFEIRFKNNTWQKIQVKLSVDGTDILTGKPADTITSKDMWVVNGYDTLSLKAWPEDNNGGAGFVFTSANNSVAIHTHGDLSSRGIIAAAVFTEGHVEPIKLSPPVEHHHHHYDHWPYGQITTRPIWIYNATDNTRGLEYKSISTIPSGSLGGTFGSTTIGSVDFGGATLDSCYFNGSVGEIADAVPAAATSLEKLVAVGAGQHVDQKINYVTGLIKPVFTETVRVKYLWWDDLVTKLRTETAAQPQPTGFPGDNRKNIDLKGTPRVGDKRGSGRRIEQQQQMFDRF